MVTRLPNYEDVIMLLNNTHMVYPQVLDVSGEALVEPEVCPPAHGHEVPEPLVRQFMGHIDGHVLLVSGRSCFLIEE